MEYNRYRPNVYKDGESVGMMGYLTHTIDLKEPNKITKLDSAVTVGTEKGQERYIGKGNMGIDDYNRPKLDRKYVDQIQKAIQDNKIGKADFKKLLEDGPSSQAQYAMGAPTTPINVTPGKGGGRGA